MGREEWGVAANGYGISFGSDDKFLKLITMMGAQLCEYTKMHFKRVNRGAGEFYLNLKIRIYTTYISLKLSLFTQPKIKSKQKINSKLYPAFNSRICGHLDPLCRENAPPCSALLTGYLNCWHKRQTPWSGHGRQFKGWLDSPSREPHWFAGEKKLMILCYLLVPRESHSHLASV